MKPTSAQHWVVSSLEALFITAGGLAAVNAYTTVQSSNYTFSSIAIIFGSVFLSAVSKGVATLLSNPQTIQAAEDSFKQLEAAMTALIASHATLLNAVTTQVVQAPQPIAQPPLIVQSSNQQPLYVPNLNATATAMQPSSIFNLDVPPGTSTATNTSTWIPPDQSIHFGDSQIVPVVAKP